MTRKDSPVAVVTGAGSGIGRATALALAREDHNVVLAGRRREPLEQVAREIASESGARTRTLVVPTDVADPEQVREMIDRTIREFGRLDILVNNAGHGELLPIEKTDLAALRRTFDTNTLGPALSIHLAWPIFQRQGSGCVINVSTAGTDDPFKGLFAYAASKAAVNLMARSCAKEGSLVGGGVGGGAACAPSPSLRARSRLACSDLSSTIPPCPPRSASPPSRSQR